MPDWLSMWLGIMWWITLRAMAVWGWYILMFETLPALVRWISRRGKRARR